MPLSKDILLKRIILAMLPVVAAAAVLVFQNVLADTGPILKNVNPQGTVTSSQGPKITLDSEDLAYCRYSKTDTNYESMGGTMTTPDGLYHEAVLGSLSKGSYTYYVRCKDFEGNSNGASTIVKFDVKDEICIGDNCTTPCTGNNCGTSNTDSSEPKLSNLLPTGTQYSSSVTLSLRTDKQAACRYSWYDKAYDAMTLPPFSSSDGLSHTAIAVLQNYGTYRYYVRCKDNAGYVNQIAGKISFYYPNPNPVVVSTPSVAEKPKVIADTVAPVISSLSPTGTIATATATISCTTDEKATCKYGKNDGDYDTLSDNFESRDGLSHSKSVTLEAPGQYIYFVRCKDAAGNKNTVSNQIGFNYEAPEKPGPEISGLQPSNTTILQANVALIATTDKPAECRYSENDVSFDEMDGYFDTSDGSLHQATVTMSDYGGKKYYIRCKDKEGNKNDRSEVFAFEYKNPNEESKEPAGTTETPAEPVNCAEVKIGEKDGVCDKTADCLCDPDCPSEGENYDKDCDHITVTSSNNAWIAIVLIGLLLLIIVVIIVIIIKRRAKDEEEVELP